jgi:hypothetical protein
MVSVLRRNLTRDKSVLRWQSRLSDLDFQHSGVTEQVKEINHEKPWMDWRRGTGFGGLWFIRISE